MHQPFGRIHNEAKVHQEFQMPWFRPFKTDTANYTLYGALFGCMFPLMATPLRAALLTGNICPESILLAQSSDPLLWIINSAPLFLGLFARFAGIRQDKIHIYATGLEGIVAERTAELRLEKDRIQRIMDLVPLGIFEIDDQGQILSPVSGATSQIIGAQPNGSATDFLLQNTQGDPESLGRARNGFNLVLGADELQYDLNSDELPNELELSIGEQKRVIELQYTPIWSPLQTVERLLIVLRDVTQVRELETEMRLQREQFLQLERFLQVSPKDLDQFVNRSQNSLQRAIEHLQGSMNIHDLELSFRILHTLKGNARILGFHQVASAAHDAEDPLQEMRRTGIQENWIQMARNRCIWCQEAIAKLRQTYMDRFANFLQTDPSNSIYLERSAVEDLLQKLQHKHLSRDKSELMLLIQDVVQKQSIQSEALHRIPKTLIQDDPVNAWEVLQNLTESAYREVQNLLKEQVDRMESIALQLQKPTPQLQSPHISALIREDFCPVLQDALGHILRNALDHGIEKPEERQNKPIQGQIFWDLRLDPRDGTGEIPILSIWDDGRGLNLNLMRKRLQGMGILQTDASTQWLCDQIFSPGLSTKEHISDISGRGVGLDAVRQILLENSSDIQVVPGEVRNDHVALRFEITLPRLSTLLFERDTEVQIF